MKKSIYITGIAGTGKTTLTKTLNLLGHEAHDIENDNSYGVFNRIRIDTGEPFLDYDKHDPEKLKNSAKIYDVEKLKALLDRQTENVAFYFGVSNENKKVMPLFYKSILLKVDPQVLNERLVAREGTEAFANNKETRELIMGWKDEFENAMIEAGMHPIDASREPKITAQAILDMANK